MKDVLALTIDDFDLSAFSKDELCEISCNLNCWIWDERLGEKPDGAGVAMSDEHSLICGILQGRIKEMVGHKAISKYWNTQYRKWKPMTNEEFEVFYENRIAGSGFFEPDADQTERRQNRLRKRIARKRIKALLPVSISGSLLRRSQK